MAGTALARGTPFKISFPVRFAPDAFTDYVIAFVRGDGLYSPPLNRGGGGSSGGAFADATVEVSGVVGTDYYGNILYQFAKGHRVNAVLLLKRNPDPSSTTPPCSPLATPPPPIDRPAQGTAFPENADQRVDMSLNWLIQE